MKRKILALLLLACLIFGLCLAGGGSSDIENNALSNIVNNRLVPLDVAAQNNNKDIKKAFDCDMNSVYDYTAWQSLSTDDVAEVVAFFDMVTLSDIWIRNGNQKSEEEYIKNARIRRIDVVVYTTLGTEKFEFKLEDIYSPSLFSENYVKGFQRMQLPKAIENVHCVELWIRNWYQGSENKYNLSITDIAFLGKAPDIPNPPVPLPETQPINQGIEVVLKQRLATRSGPSTKYTELGSFFKKGVPLRALSAAYDKVNEIWWIQVEFTAEGAKRRAYTGLKRLAMKVENVPSESLIYENVALNKDSYAYLGPGSDYKVHGEVLPNGTVGSVYALENGYAQFEFFDYTKNQKCRVWVGLDSLGLSD